MNLDALSTNSPFLKHPSLHSNCHYQKIYAKFDSKVFHPSRYGWESSPNNLDVNEQVSAFNETIITIVSYYVPSEVLTCDDRDFPWMNC